MNRALPTPIGVELSSISPQAVEKPNPLISIAYCVDLRCPTLAA
jgi:hypothetical protein